jgi:hypothetical protein
LLDTLLSGQLEWAYSQKEKSKFELDLVPVFPMSLAEEQEEK